MWAWLVGLGSVGPTLPYKPSKFDLSNRFKQCAQKHGVHGKRSEIKCGAKEAGVKFYRKVGARIEF